MTGGGDEKRKPEGGDAAEQPPAKKIRSDAGAAAAAAAPPGVKKPALPALDALAKAKAVLQKQKDLAAKLKNMPKLNNNNTAAAAAAAKAGNTAVQTASAAAAKAGAAGMPQVAQLLQQQAVQRALEVAGQIKAAAAGGGASGSGGAGVGAGSAKFPPGALRLNEKGEEVDEHGNVVKHKFVEVSTFKVNVKQQKLEEFAAIEKEAAAELAGGGGNDEPWMDPRMGKGGKRRERRGGFQVSVLRGDGGFGRGGVGRDTGIILIRRPLRRIRGSFHRFMCDIFLGVLSAWGALPGGPAAQSAVARAHALGACLRASLGACLGALRQAGPPPARALPPQA